VTLETVSTKENLFGINLRLREHTTIGKMPVELTGMRSNRSHSAGVVGRNFILLPPAFYDILV
jgi:hypothetical protein